jgi:hypothetical protein
LLLSSFFSTTRHYLCYNFVGNECDSGHCYKEYQENKAPSPRLAPCFCFCVSFDCFFNRRFRYHFIGHKNIFILKQIWRSFNQRLNISFFFSARSVCNNEAQRVEPFLILISEETNRLLHLIKHSSHRVLRILQAAVGLML